MATANGITYAFSSRSPFDLNPLSCLLHSVFMAQVEVRHAA